jgi:small subunit ribosomal protein S18
MADEVKQTPGATGSDTPKESTPSAPAASTPTSSSAPSGSGSGSGSPSTYSRPAYGARREGGSGPRPGGPRPAGGGGREGGGPGGRKFFRRKKVCKFCVEKIDAINYKDVRLLAQFVAEKGKIVPRRLTGVCTPHQRRVSAAIKQARNIALLPFASRG